MSNQLLNAAIAETDITSQQKFVLIVLCNRADDKGECFPSVSMIAQDCLLNERSVYRCLNELEAAGYFKRVKHSTRRTTLYQFQDPKIWRQPDSNSRVHPDSLSSCSDTQSPLTESHPDTPAGIPLTQCHLTPGTQSGAIKGNEPSMNPKMNPNGESARANRLPRDWVLPPDWESWALATQPAWDHGYVQEVAAQFADYWRAKAGKDACKLDWEATWRNWVRRESQFQPRAGPSRMALKHPTDFSNIDYHAPL